MLSTDELNDYTAVRQDAGLIDRHHRGRIVLRGNDRKTFLHALLTNDIVALGPNDGCYAAFLTPQGRMISDMRVFELGDAMLLDVPFEAKDTLLAQFDRMIFTEDVQLGDLTDALGCASVQGPASASMIARALGGGSGSGEQALASALAGWPPYRSLRIQVDGEVAILARVDEFGLPGFLIFAPPTRLPAIAAAIASAGAVTPDAEVIEALRIESGTPLFLVDMSDDTIPLEAGIESRALSSTKGCYPGQEVIVRIRDRGHGKVVRKLVGLVVSGETVPATGDVARVDGKEVGHVTSATFSPALGRPIALGYVHRDYVAPGSTVDIVHGDAMLTAVVSVIPFVNAQRTDG